MRALVAIVMLALAGCSSTDMTITVTTDQIVVPAQVDTIVITVRDKNAGDVVYASPTLPLCRAGQSSNCEKLPMTLRLVPGPRAPQDIVGVEVTAQAKGSPVIEDAATFAFHTGLSQRLDFILYSSCLGNTQCAGANQACGSDGRCVTLGNPPPTPTRDLAGVVTDLSGVAPADGGGPAGDMNGSGPVDLAGRCGMPTGAGVYTGFESGAIDSPWTSTPGGYVQMATTNGRSYCGSYSLQVHNSGSTGTQNVSGYIYQTQIAPANTPDIYMRAMVYYSAMQTSSDTELFIAGSSSGAESVQLAVNSQGFLGLYDNNTGSMQYTSQQIVTGTWYCLGWHIDSTHDSVTLSLDGKAITPALSFSTCSACDRLGLGVSYPSGNVFGMGNVWYDEVAIGTQPLACP